MAFCQSCNCQLTTRRVLIVIMYHYYYYNQTLVSWNTRTLAMHNIIVIKGPILKEDVYNCISTMKWLS